jgi:stearoyl-CoA desaturase (delta-9 desaturase)
VTVTIEHEGPRPGVATRVPVPGRIARGPDEHVNRRSSIPFILLHFLPLLAFVTGVTWRAVTLCVVLYGVRMLAITGGYHRYFSHRSYRL